MRSGDTYASVNCVIIGSVNVLFSWSRSASNHYLVKWQVTIDCFFLGMNINEICVQKQTISLQEMYSKISSVKWQIFYSGFNVSNKPIRRSGARGYYNYFLRVWWYIHNNGEYINVKHQQFGHLYFDSIKRYDISKWHFAAERKIRSFLNHCVIQFDIISHECYTLVISPCSKLLRGIKSKREYMLVIYAGKIYAMRLLWYFRFWFDLIIFGTCLNFSTSAVNFAVDYCPRQIGLHQGIHFTWLTQINVAQCVLRIIHTARALSRFIW